MMRNLWEKEGLLDNAQNAYRCGRGTENALMQVINGLEEAQECATNIMATSWDKKRAFDSLSRNAARIALYRLISLRRFVRCWSVLTLTEKQ
jgi:hypothetical protein